MLVNLYPKYLLITDSKENNKNQSWPVKNNPNSKSTCLFFEGSITIEGTLSFFEGTITELWEAEERVGEWERGIHRDPHDKVFLPRLHYLATYEMFLLEMPFLRPTTASKSSFLRVL